MLYSKDYAGPDPIKNSSVDFYATLELADQFCHVTIFSISDWSTKSTMEFFIGSGPGVNFMCQKLSVIFLLVEFL